jgi:CRISPR system Cascade subunit CasE
MYLSKLQLNPRHTQARRDLANPYSMHATLCWAFRKPGVGEVPPCERGKTVEPFLWRLEQTGRDAILLVQSLTSPDWQALLDRHPGYAELDEASPKPFEPTLQPGQLLRFRLRANPTVTKFDPEKGRGKRLGLAKLEEQLAWLHRQAEHSGFEVVGAMVSSSERVRARKRRDDGDEGHVITLQSVTYDGHLRVNDPDTFLIALQNGLGHAKALGFGLLSIGPVRSS